MKVVRYKVAPLSLKVRWTTSGIFSAHLNFLAMIRDT
jgi:hypothetical protein